ALVVHGNGKQRVFVESKRRGAVATATPGPRDPFPVVGEVPLPTLDGRILVVAEDSATGDQAVMRLERLAAIVAAAIRNALEFEELSRLAVTDPLTGLFNRRFFDETLTRDVAGSHRYGTPLSLLIVDIDDFKLVNDELGYIVGDHLIVDVAN